MTQKANKKKQTVFEDLFNYNANDYKEQKGRYDYISWSDALAIVLKKYPDTTWEVHEFEYPQEISSSMTEWIKHPYMQRKYLLSLIEGKEEGFKNMINVSIENKKINSSNINSYIEQFSPKKKGKNNGKK